MQIMVCAEKLFKIKKITFVVVDHFFLVSFILIYEKLKGLYEQVYAERFTCKRQKSVNARRF